MREEEESVCLTGQRAEKWPEPLKASCCLGGVLAISTSLSLQLRSGVSAGLHYKKRYDGRKRNQKVEQERIEAHLAQRQLPRQSKTRELRNQKVEQELCLCVQTANCGGVVGFWRKGRTGEVK